MWNVKSRSETWNVNALPVKAWRHEWARWELEGARTSLVELFLCLVLMRTGEQPHQHSHQGHQRGRQIHRVIGEKIVTD